MTNPDKQSAFQPVFYSTPTWSQNQDIFNRAIRNNYAQDVYITAIFIAVIRYVQSLTFVFGDLRLKSRPSIQNRLIRNFLSNKANVGILSRHKLRLTTSKYLAIHDF